MSGWRRIGSSFGLLAVAAAAVGTAGSARAQHWTFLDGPAYSGRMAAYDFARGRLVWLGMDGATWELAGTRLLQRAVDGPSPPPRWRGVLVYDFGHARTFLFGGQGADNAMLGDTWTWDGVRWTPLLGGPQPPPRVDAAGAYDIVRQRVVLFGGQQLFVGQLQDTWEHDGTQWIARTPATVPGPNSPVMSYDLVRSVTVMVTHAGILGAPVITWEWDGVDWTQRATTGPGVSSNEGMAYDLARARTVLIGGVGNTGVWEWDGVLWRPFAIGTTPNRLNPAVLYDPTRGRIGVVGGIEFTLNGVSVFQGSARTDAWEWDGATLQPVRPDLRPLSRYGHVWVEDRARGEIVLFGGYRQAALADTWTWNGTDWTQRQPATVPPARVQANGAWDAGRGLVLLFGGNSAGVVRNDLWGWNGTDWTLLDAGTGPSPRIGAALAYDPSRNVVVLFGGAQNGQFLQLRNDTWEWNGTAWTQRTTAAAPSPREGATTTFDGVRNRIVLFGGRVGATANDQLADAWEYDGTNWTRLQLPSPPPALLEPALVHDPAQGRTLLCGTHIVGSVYTTELWSLANGAWTLLDGTVNQQLGGPAAMDPVRSRIVCNKGQVIAEWAATPAQVAAYGSGCGAAVPVLAARARPRSGEPGFGFETRGGIGQPAFFAVADAQASAPLGNGCTLLVGGNAVAVLASPGLFGVAETVVPIPANVALRGLTLFAQAAVLDPAAANGFRLTQGLRFTVGD